MNRRTFLTTTTLSTLALLRSGLAGACGPTTRAASRPSGDAFGSNGVDGSFVLLDLADSKLREFGSVAADTGFLPASTFKIPNTLIGLETGVIPDANFTLKWDGVERDFVKAWNRDHDLRSAMKNSVVWYYQEIARRVGIERYRDWLGRFDYGNQVLDTDVDQFWLRGGLRISPRQQVEFLRRMLLAELPVQPEHVAIVRNILLESSADGVTIRAKTGLGQQGEHKHGWLVGFVERPDVSHVFACVVRGPIGDEWRSSPVFQARRKVALELLVEQGVVPAGIGQPT